jgi:nucleotide-binding universal stress UspA family protein
MYNTILVPLDGSERAEAILRHVEDLARRYGATVIFLQVVEPVPLSVGLERAYTVLREEFERRIKQAESYLAALQEEFCEKGIKAQTHVAHGLPAEAITAVAESEGADLIAMASHGSSSYWPRRSEIVGMGSACWMQIQLTSDCIKHWDWIDRPCLSWSISEEPSSAADQSVVR